MEKTLNSINIDKNIFTIEDAREAANQLFNIQADDFYSLKEEKWYKHLLHAITFGAGRKKVIVSDIRTLAKLQQIFVKVYYEYYKDMDTKLYELMDWLQSTNQTVKNLYLTCVIGIKPQEGLEKLSELDRSILLMVLSRYKSINDNETVLQGYRASIANLFGIGMPDGVFNPEQLDKVQAADVFYRCLVEMRVLDGTSRMPIDIEDALEYLTISDRTKKNIETQVNIEVESFGQDYIAQKYFDEEKRFLNGIEWKLDEDTNEPDIPNTKAENFQEKDSNSINDKAKIFPFNPDELENLTINGIINIENGQVREFENAEIHMNAIINCLGGSIKFSNSIIHYNEDGTSSEILFSNPNSHIEAYNCTFICHANRNKPFISESNDWDFIKDTYAIFENCTFVDCSFFLCRINENTFVACRFDNCGYDFVDRNIITISDSYFYFSDISKYDPDSYVKYYSGVLTTYSEKSKVKNCIVEFSNELYKKIHQYDKYALGTLFYFRSARIEQSTFISLPINISVNAIDGSYFNHCICPVDLSEANAKITSSCFRYCTDFLRPNSNSTISKTIFRDCIGEIDYGSSDNSTVEYCLFKNCTARETQSKYTNANGLIIFTVDRKSKGNYIKSCIFEGVNCGYSYLIAAHSYEGLKSPALYISHCHFKNCFTKRLDRVIIPTETSYWRGKKEKYTRTTSITDCYGIDDVKTGEINHILQEDFLNSDEQGAVLDLKKIGCLTLKNEN